MNRAASGLVLALALSAQAQAQSYRLRADALVQAQAPLGVLSLSGEGHLSSGVAAEAMLWIGGGEPTSPEGDALVALVSYRDPQGRGVLRAGRWVLISGALPPVHIDGASAMGRTPWGTSLEVFGGLPVVPRFGERSFDWLLGGRLGQTVGPVGFGLAYLHRRDAGQLADHELALDLQAELTEGLNVAFRGSLDLLMLGVSQASLAAIWAQGPWTAELSASQRSPARLLPATSLFTVLGDASLRQAQARLRWRVAPRLDLGLGGGARFFDDEAREDLSATSRLMLDSAGVGAINLELRRQGAPDGGWLGARLSGRVPIVEDWSASAELELVRPDEPAGRGTLWPWGLVAASWQPLRAWELSLAFEAGSSAEAVRAFDLLFYAVYRGSEP